MGVAPVEHLVEHVGQSRGVLLRAARPRPARRCSPRRAAAGTRPNARWRSLISFATSSNVMRRGPDSSWMRPTWAGSRRVATATSAMSSASTNGSPTVLSTIVREPAAISSAQKASVKFWKKKAERRIVQSAPEAMKAALGSPRPVLAAAGEEHEPACTRGRRRAGEGADDGVGARKSEIGLEGEVGRRAAVERGIPGRVVVPVERGLAVAGDGAEGVAECRSGGGRRGCRSCRCRR